MFLRTSLLSVGVWGLRRNERPSAGLGAAEKCATGDFFRLTSDIAPVEDQFVLNLVDADGIWGVSVLSWFTCYKFGIILIRIIDED